MKSVWCGRSPRRWYSSGTGSFTLHTRSAAAQISSASSMMVAPVRSKSVSGMDEPSPAPFCTSTVWPAEVSSRTPAGVIATRYSSAFTSVGIPTIMAAPLLYSSMLLITCLMRV